MRGLHVFIWGLKAFERDQSSGIDPTAKWAPAWPKAQTLDFSSPTIPECAARRVAPQSHGSSLRPRSLGRDLSRARNWCVERICAEVYATPTPGTTWRAMQRYACLRDRACAVVLARFRS